MQQANYEQQVAGFTAPGITPAERAARIDEAKMLAAYDIMSAVNDHFQFMNSNPPASCFGDAYLADIKVGKAFAAAAENGIDSDALDSAFSKRDAYLSKLDTYFSDCR